MIKKKQHYVPKFILKNYTINDNIRTYQYNKKTKESKLVSIKNISLKNYLYEIRDLNNDIDKSYLNKIENILSKLEYKWSLVIKKIKNEEELNEQNICELIEFCVIQIIRLPKIINMFNEELKQIKDLDFIDNIIIYNCLLFLVLGPYIKDIGIEFENTTPYVYNRILTLFDNKSLKIWKSKKEFVIDRDIPIYTITDNCIIYPITPNMAISFNTSNDDNIYIDVEDAWVNLCNIRALSYNSNYIISSKDINEIMSEEQIKCDLFIKFDFI